MYWKITFGYLHLRLKIEMSFDYFGLLYQQECSKEEFTEIEKIDEADEVLVEVDFFRGPTISHEKLFDFSGHLIYGFDSFIKLISIKVWNM